MKRPLSSLIALALMVGACGNDEPSIGADPAGEGVFHAHAAASAVQIADPAMPAPIWHLLVDLDDDRTIAGAERVLVTFSDESLRCADHDLAITPDDIEIGAAISFHPEDSSADTSDPPAILADDVTVAAC